MTDQQQTEKPLTDEQRRILTWLRDNPQHRSRWLVGDREPRDREGFDKWTHLEISGETGSIRIPAAVVKVTRKYWQPSSDPKNIYELSPAGHAALAEPSHD